jgi:hypothetical protein
MPAEPLIDLEALVRSVKDQLEALDRSTEEEGKEPLFQLSEMELELKFVATETIGGDGKIDLKIISFGAKAVEEAEQVQTIRLKFGLADADGRRLPRGARFSSRSRDRKAADLEDVQPL